jgi:hypothetical protein
VITVFVRVDDVIVAQVPLWMVKHASEDAVSHYPNSKIVLEVQKV